MRSARRIVGIVVVASLCLAIGVLRGNDVDAASINCPRFGDSQVFGRTTGELGLREASGVVVSQRNPGVYWTHNDNSGDGRVYALDGSGAVLAVVQINGLDVGSIEEIAHGGGNTLWLGDIGDNADARREVAFHRFDEPIVDPSWRGRVVTVSGTEVTTYRVAYRRPGTSTTWARDSEAFFVDPVSGDLFVFEKKFQKLEGERALSWVYRVPAAELAPGPLLVAEPVTPLKARLIDDGAGFTAADISRDGSLILVKNMYEVFAWPRDPGGTVADALVADQVAPCMATAEPGEAISVAPDGRSYVMLREGPRTPLWSVAIEAAGPPITVPPAPPTTSPPTTSPPTTSPPTTTPPTTTPPPNPTTAPPTTAPSTTAAPTTTTAPSSPTTTEVRIGGAGVKAWCRGERATIVGTMGDDLILGTDGPDVIDGRGGDDVIIGGAGDDLICGGSGDDVIRAGAGRDTVMGEGGSDRLFGGGGDDLVRGHGGDDMVDGGSGDDVVAGNAGHDRLKGRKGEDRLIGGGGDDLCDGGAGKDRGETCETRDST